MQKITFRLIGQSPLIQHNIQMANPLNKYSKFMKPLTGKRQKTDTDLMEISRIEWEGGIYLGSESNGLAGKVILPGRCLDACFFAGAKKKKTGEKWRTGVFFDADEYILDYKGIKINIKETKEIPNPELDKHFDSHKYQVMVRVGTSQVLRTRPIFHDWSVEATLLYDENIVDTRTLGQIAEDAGYLVGLCDRRPGSKGGGSFGRFIVEII